MDIRDVLSFLAPFSPLGRAYTVANGQPELNNSPGDLASLAKAFAAEHAKSTQAPTSTPSASPVDAVPGGLPGLQADMGWQNFDHRSANMPGMEAALMRQQPVQPLPFAPQAPQAPAPQTAQAQQAPLPTPVARPNIPVASMPNPLPTPIPQPRPAAAPVDTGGAPMGFFQRNAAMMRDPNSGDFLDPMAAQQAQASINGPGLVQKFMDLLHKESS